MTTPPLADVLEPAAVADWLCVDVEWVMRAITDERLPVLGYRADGVPLLAVTEVQHWLRRPTLSDDSM